MNDINPNAIRLISADTVRFHLLTRQELALLDLREEKEYAGGHPLFAAQLSVGRIETDILDRIPRTDTLIVVYDNGEGLTEHAVRKLRTLRYTNVAVLADGVAGWRAAGFELFEDVNSYAKAFGELVESRRHTPSLSAAEVQALIKNNSDIVVLDARRFDEYTTMNIPKSISVPGAELVLRARAIAPSPRTAIIVNCAGRTRSIIGTQSLMNAGIPNPVFALRNGTIGWVLAGQELEHGQSRRAPQLTEALVNQARAQAREVSYRAGVRHLDVHDMARLKLDTTRTLYCFDVRAPKDYLAGHIRVFRNAPGGQLLQEIDHYAPVRGARIVLADNLGSRADMTASWLAQMGWEAYVLDEWPQESLVQGAWTPSVAPRPSVQYIDPAELVTLLGNDNAVAIDLAPSPKFNSGHIPGAIFVIRAQIAKFLTTLTPPDVPLIFTSPDGVLAEFAAAEVDPKWHVKVLRGGTESWVAAGHGLEPVLDESARAAGDVYRRPYEGTDNPTAAMQGYLDWEAGLVEQLRRDGTHGFFVI